MKKLFALLLVVLMGVLPVAASAAEAPYVQFAVSDPIISVGTSADDAQTLDFSGLSVRLTSYAQDETNMLAVLDLLANGETALAFDVLLQDDTLTALLEGMSYAFTLPNISSYLQASDDADTDAMLSTLGNIDYSGVMEAINGIQLVENGQADVAFFDDETFTANAYTIDIDSATVQNIVAEIAKIAAQLGVAVDEPTADITVHVDVYTSEDESKTRVDYTVTVVEADAEPVSSTGTVLVNVDEAGNVDYYQEVAGEGSELVIAQLSIYDVDGETTKGGNFLLSLLDDDETVGEFYADFTPLTSDAGTNYSLVLGFDQQGVTLFSAEFTITIDDNGIASWSAFGGTPAETGAEAALSLEYDRDNDGAFTLAGTADGTYFHATANTAFTAGEGEVPAVDLTGLETINLLDLQTIDEETMQMLTGDAANPAMSALGVLMTIPGIAALMQAEG